MTMRERITAGRLFTDMCEGLPEERLAAKRRMRDFNALDPADTAGRAALLAEIFGSPAEVWVEPPFYFCYGRHITVGRHSYINMGCTFIDDGAITLGEGVLLGTGVTIATVGHPIDPALRAQEYMYADPVTLEDGCWIGANVTICPGVTIGKNTVVGAGSVVTKSLPGGVVAAGNPCRVLRPVGERDAQFYYKNRPVEPQDLAEEAALRGQ